MTQATCVIDGPALVIVNHLHYLLNLVLRIVAIQYLLIPLNQLLFGQSSVSVQVQTLEYLKELRLLVGIHAERYQKHPNRVLELFRRLGAET